MKKTLITLAATLAFASVAHAAACPVYEFAELQTYTKEELMAMWGKNFDTTLALGIDRPQEVENCTTQSTRILRVVKMKKDAQVTPPVK